MGNVLENRDAVNAKPFDIDIHALTHRKLGNIFTDGTLRWLHIRFDSSSLIFVK